MTKIKQGDRLQRILNGESTIDCVSWDLSDTEEAMQTSWGRKWQAETSTKLLRWEGGWPGQEIEIEPVWLKYVKGQGVTIIRSSLPLDSVMYPHGRNAVEISICPINQEFPISIPASAELLGGGEHIDSLAFLKEKTSQNHRSVPSYAVSPYHTVYLGMKV